MLQLLDQLVLLILKIISYLLAILFFISSFNFITKLISNPTTIKQLLYIFKNFPALACNFNLQANNYLINYLTFL
jgi:TRAP-type mannitol/chloroaromatic compound transport system permease small subunit